MSNESNARLLKRLLGTDSKESVAVTATPTPAATNVVITPTQPSISQSRIKRDKNSLYDQTGLTVAYISMLAIAVALWFAGAYFTLTALQSLGVRTTSLFWWLLPISITAMELWLMPVKQRRPAPLVVFFVVLALDVCSSWFGMIEVAAGRFIPLGAGFTIPSGGEVLHTLAIVISFIFAFAPEKIGRWAVAELAKVWR